MVQYVNKPTVCAHGVNYTIAAHLYTNPSESHFIARYSSDIYDYDRQEHDGNATFNVANIKSLTGLSDSIAGIPDGYHLTAVVYHLDGGEGAQRYFCQEQVRLANRMGLHFEGASSRIPSSCELCRKHIISDEDRSPWLPNGSLAVNYVISPPEKSPNKGKAPGACVHGQNSIISLSSSDEEHGWHPPMAPVTLASSTSWPSLPPTTTLSPSAHQASSSGDTEICWCVPCRLATCGWRI
jgi:hypothetical protein